MKTHPLIVVTLWLTLLLLAVGCNTNSATDEPEPEANMDSMSGLNADIAEDLNTETTRFTDGGQFEVTVSSNLEPLVINEIHSWTVHVSNADGQAIEDAQIVIDGGMPQHNHGFPTEPQITEELGNGDYLLEGVKFSMRGWWEIKLDISADGQSDSIVFNIMLP